MKKIPISKIKFDYVDTKFEKEKKFFDLKI
jgi:hypothetical protein